MEAKISDNDFHYINLMRGFSILRVVLAHLGLSWFFLPYSNYITIFLPLLFFVSGAVSYLSFHRSATIKYFLRRIFLIAIPFYIFSIFLVFIAFLISEPIYPTFNELLNWVMIWPPQKDIPFPIGQIWFLNSLAIMVILSLPIFILSKNNIFYLLFPLVVSISISMLNYFLPIYSEIMSMDFFSKGFRNQLYETATLFSFFLFGAFYYRYLPNINYKYLLVCFFGCVLITIYIYGKFSLSIDLSSHEPNSLYYISLSYSAIFLILALKEKILILCKKFKALEFILLYSSKYAFAIFLLHTLVLQVVESLLNWHDLGDQPFLALVRMFLVVFITMLIAKPFGYMTKLVNDRVIQLLRLRDKPVLQTSS